MCTCSYSVGKEQVPFSMATGNEELMQECSQALAHGNSKNEIRHTEEGKKRGVSTERSKAGTKEKRSPGGLNYPNKNTIIINIICYYFIRYGKSTMKFN